MTTPQQQLAQIDPHDLARELQVLKLEAGGAVTYCVEPFDAYVLLGCLQFAWRNPQLSAAQKRIIESFGRQLQRVFDRPETPLLQLTSELGWRIEFDVPHG